MLDDSPWGTPLWSVDRLLEVPVGHHVEDRGERLAAHQLRLAGHADDRGLDVVGIGEALSLAPAAAHDELASVGLCLLERRGHPLRTPAR